MRTWRQSRWQSQRWLCLHAKIVIECSQYEMCLWEVGHRQICHVAGRRATKRRLNLKIGRAVSKVGVGPSSNSRYVKFTSLVRFTPLPIRRPARSDVPDDDVVRAPPIRSIKFLPSSFLPATCALTCDYWWLKTWFIWKLLLLRARKYLFTYSVQNERQFNLLLKTSSL